LISPLSLQLKNHEKINKLNYDLNCGTIDAHKYLIKYLNKNEINYIDPYYNFQKAALKLNILFHNFDENHPNVLGHKIIGETILESLKF
jgi:lysophospholipase L1-like esterase